MAESKRVEPTAAGVLGALPWRDRLRIKSQALWGLCPASLRGALVWAALSPAIWLALAALTRLDPVGHYPLRWGKMPTAFFLWVPPLFIAAVFLPACRGIVALRHGGLWNEYSAAIRGVDPLTGRQQHPRFADWALFSWMWILCVFVSWIDERGLREAGSTLGHSVSWHVFNVGRIEVCVFIFVTLAAAWLSKVGVFKSGSDDGVPTSGGLEPVATTDWKRLGSAFAHMGGAMGHAVRDTVGGERARWMQARAETGSLRQAWLVWFGDCGFVARAALLSSLATMAWWGAGSAVSAALDADWVRVTVGMMTFWKFVGVAGLSALLTRLVSRRSLSQVGSALWFGPSGPSAWAWARMTMVALAADRISALAMGRSALCVEPRLAGGGILLVVMAWVGLVWLGEGLAIAGAFFEEWSARARSQGSLGIESYGKVAMQALASSWRAAGKARAQLGRAVEERALQNEEGLAQALRKELMEAVPEAKKSGGGRKRL